MANVGQNIVGGQELAGKVAIVTGASSGIGEAITRLFTQRGAHVVAGSLDEEGLGRLAGEIRAAGGKIDTAVVDVRDAGQVKQLVDLAVEAGGPDILVNNAGIGFAGTVLECTEEEWHTMMDVNAKGMFLTCKYTVPLMIERGGGVIVNIASVASLIGVRNRFGYCASKGAVLALTKALAIDHVHQGIRANCIAPGTVDTPWIGKILSRHPDPEAGRKAMEARQPMGRMGKPEEIAQAALYLASDESSFMTGSCLVVDGGITAGI